MKISQLLLIFFILLLFFSYILCLTLGIGALDIINIMFINTMIMLVAISYVRLIETVKDEVKEVKEGDLMKWQSYCGMVFDTAEERDEHEKNCSYCRLFSEGV
mgnify:FL=1